MLKLAVILAFVAAASARYLGATDTYYVDVGNQYIKITNPQGDQLKFIVDNYYGYSAPQNILVQFYGQNVPPKTVQYLDEQVPGTIGANYQSDILYQIFNKYQGPLDEIQYEKLLNIITDYVQNNQINPAILYALRALYGQYEALSYFDTYQGLYGQTPYSKLGSLYGRSYTGYGSRTPYYQRESEYGVGSYYPSKYASYGQGIYGSQYGLGFPGKYYGSYGSYGSRSGYQYGSEYPQGSSYGPYSSRFYSDSYYPQQRGYYGPYASSRAYSSYGSSYNPSYGSGYESSYYPSYGSSYYGSNYYPGSYTPGYSSSSRYQWPFYNY